MQNDKYLEFGNGVTGLAGPMVIDRALGGKKSDWGSIGTCVGDRR